MRPVPILLFLLTFLGSLALVSCGKTDPKAKSNRKKRLSIVRTKFVKPKAVSNAYAGSESCRQCHAEIMKEYESHPMSISMSPTKDLVVEEYENISSIDAGIGAKWTPTKTGDNIEHKEKIEDWDGKTITEHSRDIEFTCGSGTRGCSYFSFESGQLFQSPITWYTGESKWDLSPGYEPPFHPRFNRTASDGCMACHAGRMNPVKGERNRFDPQKPFHEIAIGCERCHGPAQAHIDFHESGKGKGDSMDPIVNPVKLDPEPREAVCYQCHLQGEQRIVRYGRSEYDFRPGMHLSDIWITFLKSGNAAGGEVEAVSQVEQMHQSECFIQSKGAMGCISCHDPHKSPTPQTRIDFYRDQCLKCHSSESNQKDECGMTLENRIKTVPDNSCMQCHMPKLKAGDVAHTAQTNHRVHIPGDKPPTIESTEQGYQLWTDKNVPSFAIERAKTIAISQMAWKQSDPALADMAMQGLPKFHPPAKDDLELREALAQLYHVKQDEEAAFKTWDDLLKQYPNDQGLLTQIALVLHESGQHEQAYNLYQRLAELNQHSVIQLQRHMDVCIKLSKPEEAAKIARRIIELNPGARFAHQWLGKYYETEGNTEKSSYHQNIAQKLPTK